MSALENTTAMVLRGFWIDAWLRSDDFRGLESIWNATRRPFEQKLRLRMKKTDPRVLVVAFEIFLDHATRSQTALPIKSSILRIFFGNFDYSMYIPIFKMKHYLKTCIYVCVIIIFFPGDHRQRTGMFASIFIFQNYRYCTGRGGSLISHPLFQHHHVIDRCRDCLQSWNFRNPSAGEDLIRRIATKK
jgi:hypothetical protein